MGSPGWRHFTTVLPELVPDGSRTLEHPLLANFQAVSHTGPSYAAVSSTQFVKAHRLISEENINLAGEADASRH